MIDMKDLVPETPLSKEQEDAALKEISYSRDQLKRDLVIIKEWLKDQHHLPASRMEETDYFLMYFLTSGKGSLERCKQKIVSYYETKNSEFFQNNDSCSEDQAKAREFFQLSILPLATPSGMRVTYGRIAGKFNNDYIAVGRHMCHVMDVSLRMQEVSSCSFFLVINLSGATNEMVTHLNPLLAKEILNIVQEGYPCRLRKLILFNAPHFAELACNYLLKPFLSKKLSERLIVTSAGHEILENLLPKDVLPKELGGTYPESIKSIEDKWIKSVIATRDQMMSEWSQTIDDSMRPPDSRITANPYFGIHGSIKKLCVD